MLFGTPFWCWELPFGTPNSRGWFRLFEFPSCAPCFEKNFEVRLLITDGLFQLLFHFDMGQNLLIQYGPCWRTAKNGAKLSPYVTINYRNVLLKNALLTLTGCQIFINQGHQLIAILDVFETDRVSVRMCCQRNSRKVPLNAMTELLSWGFRIALSAMGRFSPFVLGSGVPAL